MPGFLIIDVPGLVAFPEKKWKMPTESRVNAPAQNQQVLREPAATGRAVLTHEELETLKGRVQRFLCDEDSGSISAANGPGKSTGPTRTTSTLSAKRVCEK